MYDDYFDCHEHIYINRPFSKIKMVGTPGTILDILSQFESMRNTKPLYSTTAGMTGCDFLP